ncbi:MAG: hypothetical protein KAW56_14235 [Candidatus Marinimicrobia bacterium]|nr:hypothetical protein [candidate division WOR-3 bacterium]MCK4448226.1 hypothetical protein [Candidatus Neomarinimicrobiota bacterium]
MMSDLKLLNNSISDLHWLQKHSKEITKRHEGEFVAVKNKKIIASAPNNEILVRRLKEKKVNITTVIIQFIPQKKQIVIF